MMNVDKMDLEMRQKEIADFFVNLMEVLDIHAEALKELYTNQRNIVTSLKSLSERNDQLMRALMLSDESEIN